MVTHNVKHATGVKVIKTVCGMCNNRCGLDVYVKDGKVIKVTDMEEHPIKTLCVRALAIPELLGSPERLTNPLRKIDGKFREVSWDEAFNFVVDKLTYIKQRYGARSVVVHMGNPFIRTHVQRIGRRLCDIYGTPNYTTGNSFCFWTRTMATSVTCAKDLWPHYSLDTKCAVVWGANATESWPRLADDIRFAARRGAKLIVIDPRVTPLAREAHIHAQIRPGTDMALALGLLNTIITEELYDKDFVEKWTIGFDRLVEHVKQYSPESVEEITWVPAETIRNIARTYATNKPGSIMQGISMDHHTNGCQTARAITILIAITGNLDVSGGNVYSPYQDWTNIRMEEKVINETAVGNDYPLFGKYVGETTVSPVLEQIFTEKPYPIKGLLFQGVNPALTWPNSNKVKEAIGKLDLVVAIDVFMTDSTKMADVVLPGTTFLERRDLLDYYNQAISLLTLTNKVIEPIGNSMEDWKIWSELGKRMGYAEYFPWRNADELFEHLLKSMNISLDKLKENPAGIYYAPREFKKYLKDGFNTPSKKVEIYSEVLKQHGYEPLPSYHEPPESPFSRTDLIQKYPLLFIAGTKNLAYTHSKYRNLPSLRKLMPEPLLEINPGTAYRLGIANGDWVRVESLRGNIELKAKLTEYIHPKVVSIELGWSEANANCLSDDMTKDPVSGYPAFREVMCRVQKVKV